MSVLSEVEEKALSLTQVERGELITKLLRSLPPFPSEPDEGLAVAKRRRQELRENPGIGITLEELDRRMSERFR